MKAVQLSSLNIGTIWDVSPSFAFGRPLLPGSFARSQRDHVKDRLLALRGGWEGWYLMGYCRPISSHVSSCLRPQMAPGLVQVQPKF